MKLLASAMLLCAATSLLAADAPAGGARGLWKMLCTQEGVGKGLKEKDLEAFIGKCMQAREAGQIRDEFVVPPEMANC